MLDSDSSSPKKEKKKLTFFKIAKSSVHFQDTWLNTVAEKEKVNLTKKLNDGIKKHGDKFKYLFSVPNIITDPKLIERRKTFEAFSKNANLELYYMQLKKATGIAKTISQKADYKEVVSRIRNTKIQDQYMHKLQNNKGYILTNELWSQKLLSQIYDQSRLKELSELLQLQKIKLNSEEQLMNFEQFFATQMKGKDKTKSVPELREDMQKAFRIHEMKQSKHQEDQTTLDYSNKQSRILSRNASVPMKYTDQSFFTREIMTAQIGKKRAAESEYIGIKSKLNDLLQQTVNEVHSTQKVISKVKKFVKEEAELQERPKQLRIKKIVADRINQLLSFQKKTF